MSRDGGWQGINRGRWMQVYVVWRRAAGGRCKVLRAFEDEERAYLFAQMEEVLNADRAVVWDYIVSKVDLEK